MVEEYCEAEGERLISGEVLGYLAQELPKEDQQKSVYEFFFGTRKFLESDTEGTEPDCGKISHRS